MFTVLVRCRICHLLMAILALPLLCQTAPARGQFATGGQPPGKPAFNNTGTQVNQQLPNLEVTDLDGKALQIGEVWAFRPTLLLTSSLTCPASRNMFPAAQELAEKYKNKIDVAIIYIIEAHPKGDICPYTGVEEVTPQNLRDGILFRQPTTLDRRRELAAGFKDRLHVQIPMYVDSMDNSVWKSMGGGPNMAVLISPDGIVQARQGWFAPAAMANEMNQLLEHEAQEQSQLKKYLLDPLNKFRIEEPFTTGDTIAAAKALRGSPWLALAMEQEGYKGSEEGYTLLDRAVEADQIDIARLLLRYGADVNVHWRENPTPLNRAIQKGNFSMVRLLLDKKANVNGASPVGPSPLEHACLNCQPKIAEALRHSGAKPTFLTDIAQGNLQRIREQLHADPTLAFRPDGHGSPPLYYAAANGRLETAKLLLDAGAGVDRQSISGALAYAIHSKHDDLLNYLLDNHANPNDKADAPLQIAVRANNVNAIKILLARHATLQIFDSSGNTPLHNAAYQGCDEIIELLLAAGANINLPSGPLTGACAPNDYSNLLTPLHSAAMGCHSSTLKLLLDHGAKVDPQNSAGQTPLHILASQADAPPQALSESIQLLLSRGANPNALDQQNKNPLDLALACKNTTASKLLQSHNAAQDKNRATNAN